MSAHDFLLHNQPTASTVRVLWYLHTFFQEKMWQDGLAFERELRACRLDYSPESLCRIDDLLRGLRESGRVADADAFFGEMANQNFLSLLAFYCGELVGRTRRQAAVWLSYDALAGSDPEAAAAYPPALWTDFLAEFRNYDGSRTLYFPLKSLCGALFGNTDETDVLRAAAALMPPDAPAQTPAADVPPQSLDFSIRHALSATDAAHLPYLQMLAPCGSANEPLSLQLDALGTLYRQGRVVWAAAVEAAPSLAESGNTRSAAVEVVYDPSGRTDTETLRQAARSLAVLKHADDEAEEGADDAADAADADGASPAAPRPRTSPFHRIPSMVSHMPLQTATLFVWLPHLPDGVLRLPVFPILIDESTRAVTLLPARYWAHTQHYRDWLECADPKVPAETAPAFAALLADEPDFWRDYPELVRPLREEVPDLGQFPEPYAAADSKLGRRLVKNYRTAAQSTYPRFAEDLPAESDIAACAAQLHNGEANTFPERIEKYARLRLADFGATLMELADPAANRLLNRQALPHAAEMLKRDPPPDAYQCARFVHGLMRQSQTNSTAAVYLAYLYAVGRFVPQSLCEAAAWAHQAADAGDWRATKLLADILLAAPHAAPELYYETVSNDTYVILSDLKEAGLSTKEIEQQKKAFLGNRQAVMETVRRQLLRAGEQGDPTAQVRLQQLIDTEAMPAEAADARYTGIKNWLAIYAERSDQPDPAPLVDSSTLLKKPSADNTADLAPPRRKLRRLLLLLALLASLLWWASLQQGWNLHHIKQHLLGLWQSLPK
ncbi:hypothetical protein [Conchiformibius kuhniae]|uniref:Sel1 repeat family protein n=1 Tax=Conchiformibius kuhniae TaxID=211502 RepID=A0ABD8B768_9NEIS|nr:hypothetical protein [Conchiformibius kuhniae]